MISFISGGSFEGRDMTITIKITSDSLRKLLAFAFRKIQHTQI